MTSNRRPSIAALHPAIDEAGRTINAGLLAIAASLRDAFAPAETISHALPTTELIECRYLGTEHLGRWVSIRHRPEKREDLSEPSRFVTAGRLVGIRGGDREVGGDQVARRNLVIQAGSNTAAIPTRVDIIVEVAPREWS